MQIQVIVAIHNKNGKGLLQILKIVEYTKLVVVAIHNKNGKGLLLHYIITFFKFC